MIPNRPNTTLPELQRDLREAFDAIGPFARARNILDVEVAATETPVAHGLPGVPQAFYIMPTSAGGPVRRSRASDARFLYLISASGTVTCDVAVVP